MGLEHTTIALLTPYGGGNIGDGAIQTAVIKNLTNIMTGGLSVIFLTLYPDRTTAIHGIPSFPLAVVPIPFYSSRFYKSKAVTSPSDYSYLNRPNDMSRNSSCDGLLTKNLIDLVKRKYFVTRTARMLRRLVTIFIFELSHWLAAYRLLHSVKALIFAGGGQIDDEWGGAWGHPYACFKWSILAVLAKRPIFALSLGASRMPARKLSRFFFRQMLNMADYRSVRDDTSAKIIMDLGVRKSTQVVPDLAFSLDVLYPKNPCALTKDTVVGVGPIGYYRAGCWPQSDDGIYQSYVNALAGCVSHLADRGCKIVFFRSEYTDAEVYDDLNAAISKIIPSGRIIKTFSHTVTDLLSTIAQVDYVIASRLHSLILSFLLGKPSIALSFDPKVESLMRDFGQSAFCLNICTATTNAILSRYEELCNQRVTISAHICDVVRNHQKRLERQYRELSYFLSQIIKS